MEDGVSVDVSDELELGVTVEVSVEVIEDVSEDDFVSDDEAVYVGEVV